MKMKLMLLTIGGLLFTACKNNKIGDTIVEHSIDLSEISIDNYPHGRTGIEGGNTITFPEGFSIQKIDEVIYDLVKTKDFKNSIVNIKYRFVGHDQYGKDTLGKWLNVGSLDVSESKKYVDFWSWNKNYSFLKLLNSKVMNSINENSPNTTNSETSSTGDVTVNKPLYKYGGYDFDSVKGENTTDYNQSNENLRKLNWRVLEDVFFKDHLDSFGEDVPEDEKPIFDQVTFKGKIVDIKFNLYDETDAIDIIDDQFGKIRIFYHSLYSKKTIIRPAVTIGVGDEIKGWGAMVKYMGKPYYYLNQAVLTR